MSAPVAVQTPAELLERVVVGGNLANLSATERLNYYRAVCESVGLNPLTRPFEYITLNNKLTLYAKRDATDQLRGLHGVSIERIEREVTEGIYCVTAYARDSKGRTDTSLGAVAIEGLKGEARANAMMKAETKAKRRVTLSICGLGLLDETEVETIPGAVVGEPKVAMPLKVDTSTGEVIEAGPDDAADNHVLLDAITKLNDEMGVTPAKQTLNWRRIVGPEYTEETAPAEKLLALHDFLAKGGR